MPEPSPIPAVAERTDRFLAVTSAIYFFFCTAGLFHLLLSGGDYLYLEELLPWKIGVAILQGLCVIVIIRRRHLIWPDISVAWLLFLVFLALPLASTIWSLQPLRTFTAGIGVLITGLFTVVAIRGLGQATFIRQLFVIHAILAVLSLGFGLFLPDLGRMHADGETPWRGCFMHKNVLGYSMLIGLLAALAVLAAKRGRRIAFGPLACAALCFLLILLSSSKTSLVAMAACLAAIFFFDLNRQIRVAALGRLVVTMLAAVALLCAATIYRSEISELVVANQDLTGRTQLWRDLSQAVEERPLVGYGFLAFWASDSLQARTLSQVTWQSGKAHNALLDMALDTGVFGLLIVAALFAVVLGNLSRTARLAYATEPSNLDYTPGTYCFFITYLLAACILGFSENRLILQNYIHFVLLTACYCFFAAPRRSVAVQH